MKKVVLTLIVVTLAACSNDVEDVSAVDSQHLKVSGLSILNSDIHSRAALWNTEFPDNSKIGISLFYNDSQTVLSLNTEWTVNNAKWTTKQAVPLSREKATAYAYYPYKEGVSDITSIPITYDYSDYMYGQSTQTDISSLDGKNMATFVMRHIMTRMSLSVRKESTYKGAGLLTKIMLRNAPRRRVLPADASLIRFNGKTGVITHTSLPEAGSSVELTTDGNIPISYPVTLSVSTSPAELGSTIVAPFSFSDGDVELFLVVDGEEYVVPILSPKGLPIQMANGGWQANCNYRYKLTLTPKHMSISSLTVNDWVEIYDIPTEIK